MVELSHAGETLHARLRELRDRLGDRSAAIADKAGVSRQSVWKWFKGLSVPTDDNLKVVAAVYGVDFMPLRFGSQMTSAVPLEPPDHIEQVEALDILRALPSDMREAWIAMGRTLVQRFAPAGKQPFPPLPPSRDK